MEITDSENDVNSDLLWEQSKPDSINMTTSVNICL